MTKIAVSGDPSGTGTFTIAAPNSNNSRTLTLPDETAELVTTAARGLAKAWVNFNGTGTVAIRDSENVSSLTDNATGDYRVNFSSSFVAVDYAPSGSCNLAGSGYQENHYALTVSQMVARTINGSSLFVDNNTISSSVMGDLA